MAGVENLAAGLHGYVSQLGGLSNEVAAASGNVSQSWRGAAAEQFTLAVGKVPAAVAPAQASAAAAGAALQTYAGQVRSIEARSIQATAAVESADLALGRAHRNARSDQLRGVDMTQSNQALQSAAAAVERAQATADELVRARESADTVALTAMRQAMTTLLDGRAQQLSFLQWFASATPAATSTAATAPAPTAARLGAGDIPVGQTPEEVAAWWEEHASQQTWLKLLYPDLLRNLDGIPALDRDEMNRRYLANEKASVEKEIADALLDQQRRFGMVEPGRLAGLYSRLTTIETLEQGLNDPKYPGRLLLLLDLAGGVPKAAVATGNIDTASHVAVLTGGVSTTVDGTRGPDGSYTGGMLSKLADAERVRGATARSPYSSSIAVVAWMGYEAPYGLNDRASWTAGRAEQGASALASFSRAINATHKGDPHLTLVGHSYGSTVTGIAAEQSTGADDVIVVGSPGVGSGPKQVADGHLYAMRSPNDFIAAVTDKGAWGAAFGASGVVLGGRPLGADPIDSDNFTVLATVTTATTVSSTGHSEYFKDDSTSLHNIASIVSGKPELVVPD